MSNPLNDALIAMARTDYVDGTKYLLEKGADINYVGPDKYSAIWAAVIFNKQNQVEFLIEKKADLTQTYGVYNLLHYVINNNISLTILKLLLDAKCDCNLLDTEGRNALYIACYKNNTDAVKLLLNYSSKVAIDICDASKISMLYYALYYIKNIEIAQLLLDAGANPNIQNKTGCFYTVLMGACATNDKKKVKLLLKYSNIDLNIKDSGNQTALQIAEKYKYPETADLLKKYAESLTPKSTYPQKMFNKDGKEFPVLIPKKVINVVEAINDKIVLLKSITIPVNTRLEGKLWSDEKKQWDWFSILSDNELTIELANEKIWYHNFPNTGFVQFDKLTLADGTNRYHADLYY